MIITQQFGASCGFQKSTHYLDGRYAEPDTVFRSSCRFLMVRKLKPHPAKCFFLDRTESKEMKFSKFLLVPLLINANVLLAQPGNTVTYHATIDTVKYVYGPAEPVARLRPGDILDTN